MKKVLFWIFTGFCLGITPYIFHLANLERGYNAIGGEMFIPLIPLLVWLFHKTGKDFIKSMKGEVKRND